MRREAADAARLWDMVDFAHAISTLVGGRTLADYRADRQLRLATERAREGLGEAARHVSEPFRDAHPEIPWSRMTGLRNILAHDYGENQDEKVWDVATRAVPDVIPLLEAVVAPEPPHRDP